MSDAAASLPFLGVLLLLALLLGFLAGRRLLRPLRRLLPRRRAHNPVRGLNYLLNENPDDEIDALIAGFERQDGSLEAHLALGTLLRRRGESDRAIALHQRLLARPGLDQEGRSRVELELARDFLAAGLLNRAESLLAPLVGRKDGLGAAALEVKLRLEERERDWVAAARTARLLAKRGQGRFDRNIAHYQCELAQEAWDVGDPELALSLLEDALRDEGNCVRATLLCGRIELEAGRYRDACFALERVSQQDPRFLPEALPALVAAHHERGTERDLITFIEACLEAHPSPALAAYLAQTSGEDEGAESVRTAVAEALAKRPDMSGLDLLLGQYETSFEGPAAAALARLRAFSARLLADSDPYACDACGFSGSVLHWQCPRCRSWGTTAPRGGLFG